MSEYSPKKLKKRSFVETEEPPASISNDEDVFENGDDDESEQKESGLVPPSQILPLLERFNAFIVSLEKKPNSAALKRLALDFLRSEHILEEERVANAMCQYFKIFLRPRNLLLTDMLPLMMNWLHRPEAVTMEADFPARPPTNLLYYYSKKHSLKGSSLKDNQRRIKNDPAGKAEAEAELENAQKEYLKELKVYAEVKAAESDFPAPYLKYVREIIKKLEAKFKPVSAKRAVNGSRSPKKQKISRTPFDIFCAANTELYKDMDDERRQRKLQKKFDKLDDSVRNMFITLALQE